MRLVSSRCPLQVIAIIVFGFFVLMLVLTAVTFSMDQRYIRTLMAQLRSPKYGWRVEPNGAWTWHVTQTQDPFVTADAPAAGHFSGGFADLCKLIGAPACRIRAAIPEEVLPGSIGAQAITTQGDERLVCDPVVGVLWTVMCDTTTI